jgi:hypothetical protein
MLLIRKRQGHLLKLLKPAASAVLYHGLVHQNSYHGTFSAHSATDEEYVGAKCMQHCMLNSSMMESTFQKERL